MCGTRALKQQMYECMYVYLHTLTQLTNPFLKSDNKHLHKIKHSSTENTVHTLLPDPRKCPQSGKI